jgi:ribosomal protein S6--L-glutamate ligase
MIVSFHPIFPGDRNVLCAGRDPGPAELAAIRGAHAVVLPQGCPRPLYEMARNNCPHVFPDYEARFRYPGKTGQIRLFGETGTPHPPAEVFPGVAAFRSRYGDGAGPRLPCVFKFDWGGEGETVFAVRSRADLDRRIAQAAAYEATGQSGFLLQRLVPTGNRSLRIAVIGGRPVSYWRVYEGRGRFAVSLSKGARIDTLSDPDRVHRAERLVAGFCRRTGINLAGLDLIFDENRNPLQPLLIEVNYFFGRVGLGGSKAFYRVLRHEIRQWLERIGT